MSGCGSRDCVRHVTKSCTNRKSDDEEGRDGTKGRGD